MTWHPWNYRIYMIYRLFFCVHGNDVASQKVQKVQNITSFLLRAEDDTASQELQNVHDISSFLLHARI
jgi:hypothetical protein